MSWKVRPKADGYGLSPLLRVMVLLPVGEGSDLVEYPSTWTSKSRRAKPCTGVRQILSLQVPPQVSMRKLDSFAEHVVQVRVYLIVWQNAVFG